MSQGCRVDKSGGGGGCQMEWQSTNLTAVLPGWFYSTRRSPESNSEGGPLFVLGSKDGIAINEPNGDSSRQVLLTRRFPQSNSEGGPLFVFGSVRRFSVSVMGLLLFFWPILNYFFQSSPIGLLPCACGSANSHDFLDFVILAMWPNQLSFIFFNAGLIWFKSKKYVNKLRRAMKW